METRTKIFCGGSATEAQEKHIAEVAITGVKKQRYRNKCDVDVSDRETRGPCDPMVCGNEDFYKLTVTVERVAKSDLPW